MHPILPKRLMALLAVVTMAGFGCSHTHQPQRTVYIISEGAIAVGPDVDPGTGGAGAEAYCNELEKTCFKTCWGSKPDISSIKKGSGMHHEHCTRTCREEFTRCVKKQEELERQESMKRELHFPTVESALAWLREHKTEVALGTIVIIAGVAAAPYVVAVAAGGALILAPL
jgi:hypothetical protein